MIKSAPPLARFFVTVPVKGSLRMLFHAGDGEVRSVAYGHVEKYNHLG